MSKQQDKPRKLSTYEFFEIVQVEYICCRLRAKIYTRPKDKDYWNKVAEGKRRTIEEIADRNKLPSIFSDIDVEAALRRRVFRENTYPVFVYKDENQRLTQEYWDLLYYYNEGTHVRYETETGIEVGIVHAYKPFDKFVQVITPENSIVPVSVDSIIRVI